MTAIHQHNKNIGTRQLLIFCLQILYCRVAVVACKRLIQTIRHLVSDKSFMLLSALIDSALYSVTSCLYNTETLLNITKTRNSHGGRKLLKITPSKMWVSISGVPRGGGWGVQTPLPSPEIPKISVESSIA